MPSNIRIVSTNDDGSIEDSSLQGGKIRIVSSEASSPRRVIRVNQEPQITINQGMEESIFGQIYKTKV